MGRPRTHNLPERVQRKAARGRVYYYYRHKNGDLERIKGEPTSSEFLMAYDKLHNGFAQDISTMSGMISAYKNSNDYIILKPATKKQYNRRLDLLNERLGQYRVDSITPPVMMALRDSLEDQAASANMVIIVARTLFKWAIPRGHATTNPCREIKPLKEAKEGSRPWTLDDFDLALQHSNEPMRRAILLGRYTGQRLSDVVRMRKSHIDGTEIWVKQQKTGKELWIPIHRDLQPLIEEVMQEESDLIVHRGKGEPFTKSNWYYAWRQRTLPGAPLAAIKEDGKSFHGLRKLAAVSLKEAGCEIGHIQSITGQSPQMVEHYTKEVNQRKMAREAMNRLEAAD